MKRIIWGLAVVLFIIGAYCVPPSYSEPLKIGYMDATKVLDGYERTKESEAVFEKETKAKQAKRDKLVSEITRLRDELELLSEKGKNDKQLIIDEKVKELKDFDKVTRGELKEKRDEMLTGILREVDSVVQGYAGEKGYDLILNDKVIIYKTQTLDVTDDILNILNTQYKSKDK